MLREGQDARRFDPPSFGHSQGHFETRDRIACDRSIERGRGREVTICRQAGGRGDSEVSRVYNDEEGRGTMDEQGRIWVIALEADHRDTEAWLTYRSNS